MFKLDELPIAFNSSPSSNMMKQRQSEANLLPPTSRLQWFYNLPIRRKQLIGLFTLEIISIVGLVGVGVFLIVLGGRTQLRNQAKSELAVTEIHYNIKIDQMGFGFRGQSDNAAIIEAAKTHATGETLDDELRSRVKEILTNEIKARNIEYATLVGKDLRIIVNGNRDRSGERFNPNNLVTAVLNRPQQIKTSEIVSWEELVKESPPLISRQEKIQPLNNYALIRYTITPVKDPQTKTVLGTLISGDVVNGKPLIVSQTVETLDGGYSAIYLRENAEEFTLATSVQDIEDREIVRNLPPRKRTETLNVPLPDTSLLKAAVEAAGKYVTARITVGGKTYSLAAKSLSNFAGEPVAILLRGTPEVTLNELLKNSLLLQLLVSVLALAADVLLAIFLGRAIARPLEQLQQTTQQFSANNLKARAKVFAADEVGELAVTFNKMADNILAVIHQLEESTQEQAQLNNQYLQQIVERERVEERLRLIESAVVNAYDGVLIAEAIPIEPPLGPKIVYVNQAFTRITGYSSQEAIGQTPRILQGPNTQRSELDKIRAALLQHQPVTVELINYHKNGSEFWSELSIVPLADREGTLTHFVSVVRDVTERKQAEVALQEAEAHSRKQAETLAVALQKLKQAQAQLVQTEKMSSLGQMVAGVAHEINNPVNFIYGNINHAHQYLEDFLELLRLYQQHYPHPAMEIERKARAIDLEFAMEDLPKLLQSMKIGANRIQEIVLSLRNFSRLDESELKWVDIREGLDNTLLILKHRLKASSKHPEIRVVKDYGDLPRVECYPGQLNQVFMNILANAIDALEESVSCHLSLVGCQIRDDYISQCSIPNLQIEIRAEVVGGDRLAVRIRDNGPGIPHSVSTKLFDPFFTTKPVGKGTGLGLSISYQIVVEKHSGSLKCISAPGQGAEFIIEVPIQRQRLQVAC